MLYTGEIVDVKKEKDTCILKIRVISSPFGRKTRKRIVYVRRRYPPWFSPEKGKKTGVVLEDEGIWIGKEGLKACVFKDISGRIGRVLIDGVEVVSLYPFISGHGKTHIGGVYSSAGKDPGYTSFKIVEKTRERIVLENKRHRKEYEHKGNAIIFRDILNAKKETKLTQFVSLFFRYPEEIVVLEYEEGGGKKKIYGSPEITWERVREIYPEGEVVINFRGKKLRVEFRDAEALKVKLASCFFILYPVYPWIKKKEICLEGRIWI